MFTTPATGCEDEPSPRQHHRHCVDCVGGRAVPMSATTAPHTTSQHRVVIAPYPGACRCSGARDGLNSPTTHYTDDPNCNNNPDNTTVQGETT